MTVAQAPKPVLLNTNNYFDIPLFTAVMGAMRQLDNPHRTCNRAYFVDQGAAYTYYMVDKSNQVSYSLKELQDWVHEGTVVDVSELFINIYKSVHGFKPWHGSPAEWKDLTWLHHQIRAL